jgi:hypothetical protein
MKIVENQIERPGDIPYELSIKLLSDHFRCTNHLLLISAPIVGTNGGIYDEQVTNIFGQIKITKRAVQLAWRNNSVGLSYRSSPVHES